MVVVKTLKTAGRVLGQAPFWALAALVCTWHLARVSSQYAAHGYVTLGHIIAPWLVPIVLVAAFGAALLRRWPLAVALGIALAPLLIGLGPAFLRAPQAVAASDKNGVRVLSFNMHGKTKNTRHAAIAEMLKRENADVVLLQECYPQDFERLSPALKTLYPYALKSVENGGSFEQVILSRWPLEPLGTEARNYHLLKGRVQTPGGVLQVWNAHSFRLNLLPQTQQAAQDSWRGYADPEKFALSEGQYAWLHRELEQFRIGDEPLILAGDFNLPARSYEFERLTQKFNEAHATAGFGIGMTFPRPDAADATSQFPMPIARIDHIFVDVALQTVSARVAADAAGSDHAPVIADIVFRER